MGPALRRAHEIRQHLGGDPAKRVGGSPLALRTKNAPALDLQARESKRGMRVETAHASACVVSMLLTTAPVSTPTPASEAKSGSSEPLFSRTARIQSQRSFFTVVDPSGPSLRTVFESHP